MRQHSTICVVIVLLSLAALNLAQVKPTLPPKYTAAAWKEGDTNATDQRIRYRIYADNDNQQFRVDRVAVGFLPAFDQFALNDNIYHYYPDFAVCKIYKHPWVSSWSDMDNATFAGNSQYEYGKYCNLWATTYQGHPGTFCFDGNTLIYITNTDPKTGKTGVLHFTEFIPKVIDSSIFIPPSYCKPVLNSAEAERLPRASLSLLNL